MVKAQKIYSADALASGDLWACGCGFDKNKLAKENCIVCGKATRPDPSIQQQYAGEPAAFLFKRALAEKNPGIFGMGMTQLGKDVDKKYITPLKEKAAKKVAQAQVKMKELKEKGEHLQELAEQKQLELLQKAQQMEAKVEKREGMFDAYTKKLNARFEGVARKVGGNRIVGGVKGVSRKIGSAKNGVVGAVHSLNVSNMKAQMKKRRNRLKKAKRRKERMRGQQQRKGSIASLFDDDIESSEDEYSDSESETEGEPDGWEMEVLDVQAEQRRKEEAKRRRLREEALTDEEEQARKAHLKELLAKIDGFDLEKVLVKCQCGEYTGEMDHRGFNDVGAFSQMQERELKDMFIRPQRRVLLLQQAREVKKLLDEVEGMGQHDLVNRLMERDETQHFSCDGVHFYNTVEEMEMAWVEEQTRPTLPKLHEPYIVPPEVVKRRDYHVEPMCFPITDTPLALLAHSSDLYHHVFSKLLDEKELTRTDNGKRLDMLMNAVATGSEEEIIMDIDVTDEKEIARDAPLYDQALLAALMNSRLNLLPVLLPYCTQPAIDEALLVAAGRNMSSSVDVIRRQVPEQSTIGRAFTVAAQRGYAKTVLVLVSAVSDEAKNHACVAAGSKGYMEVVELLFPMLDARGKKRVTVLATIMSQKLNKEALINFVEASSGDNANPMMWTPARVVLWLKNPRVGFEDLISFVRVHKIGGEKLLALTAHDLKTNFGMKKRGPRTRFLTCIEVLKMDVPSERENEDAEDDWEDEEEPVPEVQEEKEKEEGEEGEEGEREEGKESELDEFVEEEEEHKEGDLDDLDAASEDSIVREEREAAELAAFEALPLTDTPDYWDVCHALNLIGELYGGWFENRMFMDATARSDAVVMAAAIEKNFNQVKGITDDYWVYDKCIRSLRRHRQHQDYDRALPEQRHEQDIEFDCGDTMEHDWSKAYILLFNTINDPKLFAELQSSKVAKDKLRALDANSFVIIVSNPDKKFKPWPGWRLCERWLVEKESMRGYMQIYKKTAEKGEYTEEEMLLLLEG